MVLIFVKIVLLYVLGILISEVISDRVKITKFKVYQVRNDYIGRIKYSKREIDTEASAISMTFPIKKYINTNLKVEIKMNYMKIPVLRGLVLNFCDAFNNPKLLKPFMVNFEPIDENPMSCPLPIGDWKLVDYSIETENHCPIGAAPGGEYEVEIKIGKSMREPYIRIVCVGIAKLIPNPSLALAGLFNWQ